MFLTFAVIFEIYLLVYINNGKRIGLINSIFLYCGNLNIKIHFLLDGESDPLTAYQKQLIENCHSVNEANYLFMSISNYFLKGNRRIEKWNQTYKDLIFSKKIIAFSGENFYNIGNNFDFRHKCKITAFVGNMNESILRDSYKTKNAFYIPFFMFYSPAHHSNYSQFINRKYYIETAIKNSEIVKSNRNNYLKACMNHFGNDKIANYGRLFHNCDFPNNSRFSPLPPTAYFGFSMENSICPFYITEKLFTMYRDDVIPIYRGHTENIKILKEIGVNTNAFIDASNMTVDELVNYLHKLIYEEDKKTLYQIYKEPLIFNKSFFDQQLINRYKRMFDQIEIWARKS